jgi:hypothetical protein
VSPDGPTVAGETAFVRYPGAVVDLPGTGTEATLRATNLTGVPGLFLAGDSDVDQDGIDDRVAVSLISAVPSVSIPEGEFARIDFDCVSGAVQPTIDQFRCEPEGSTVTGNDVPLTCELDLSLER